MGLPSKRRCKSQRLRRFDENGNAYLPHHAVPATGTYKGKKAVAVKTKAVKKAK